MTGPTKAQLDHQFKMQLLRLCQKLAFYVTLVAIFWIVSYYLYLSIRELAGRQTTASILLSLYGILKAPRALSILFAYLFAALASAWGYGERRGKKRAIARLHPLARQAQLQVDPHKGSSKITPMGDTRPGDL